CELFVFHSGESACCASECHQGHNHQRDNDKQRSDKDELRSEFHVSQHFPPPVAVRATASTAVCLKILQPPCAEDLPDVEKNQHSSAKVMRPPGCRLRPKVQSWARSLSRNRPARS